MTNEVVGRIPIPELSVGHRDAKNSQGKTHKGERKFLHRCSGASTVSAKNETALAGRQPERKEKFGSSAAQ